MYLPILIVRIMVWSFLAVPCPAGVTPGPALSSICQISPSIQRLDLSISLILTNFFAAVQRVVSKIETVFELGGYSAESGNTQGLRYSQSRRIGISGRSAAGMG